MRYRTGMFDTLKLSRPCLVFVRGGEAARQTDRPAGPAEEWENENRKEKLRRKYVPSSRLDKCVSLMGTLSPTCYPSWEWDHISFA